MNIVFFGSSSFALPSLKALVTGGYNISCVVTQPDRKRGRGMHVEGTSVKQAASEYGLLIHQPQSINSAGQIKFLKSLNPDLFVVISYGQILSGEVLAIPKVFALNSHASILPEYRGAAPINWAIINGEKTTGVTIIKMTEKMDAGPIILQEKAGIEDSDTAISLQRRLSEVVARLLEKALELIEGNDYSSTPQDENKVTFAPKLKKEDGLINWKMRATDIYNLIRGCVGWPGAFTYYKGKLLKIYKASVFDSSDYPAKRPGEISEVSKKGIIVACLKSNLLIRDLQIEGKKIMSAEEFIAGHRIKAGEMLGKISCM